MGVEVHFGSTISLGSAGGGSSIQGAEVTSISPSSMSRGESGTITIYGSGFDNVSGVSFGSQVTVTATRILSTTKIECDVTISPTATLDQYDVIVTSVDSLTDGLTIDAVESVGAVGFGDYFGLPGTFFGL